MDKKGRKSDQGPRNISHRSRNLFNSIINLTPLGIKTPAPQRLSPADLPSSPTDRKLNNDTINLSTKVLLPFMLLHLLNNLPLAFFVNFRKEKVRAANHHPAVLPCPAVEGEVEEEVWQLRRVLPQRHFPY
jgi:hypothetical protein